jgi:predicted Zn-dependent peptidase
MDAPNAPAPARAPAAGPPVEQYTLGNGLRVVLAPERTSPVVGVCVGYDVGSRSEPEGRAGFAHLFEHLMFQGSAKVGRKEHVARVQGCGGSANAATHLDFTDFYQAVPAASLEQVLFLEADRMRGPRITEEELRGQVAVVCGEIRGKVSDVPYGGFPGVPVAGALFETFHNAHDGWGSAAELGAVTVEEAADFHERYYAPANAVLTVAGDFSPERAAALVEAHFGGVPARPAPPPAALDEPPPAADRHHSYRDPRAPLAALAAAWRVPDPVRETAAYLPYAVLAELLTGAGAVLTRRLVLAEGLAAAVGGRLGLFNEPFTVRHPTGLVLTAHLRPGGTAEAALRVLDDELERAAAGRSAPPALNAARAALVGTALAGLDGMLDRARRLGAHALLHGDATTAATLPAMLATVTPDQVAAAAATLRAQPRTVVEVLPGGAR